MTAPGDGHEFGQAGDPSGPRPGPGEQPADQPSTDQPVEVPDDISGIDDLPEEGAAPQPQDIPEVEGEPVAGEPSADDAADPVAAAQQEAAERLADLQRLQAEFLNYKRRVERDRELIQQNAVFKVLTPMLDVLDNIERAREAGELTGGFQALAVQLETIVSGQGLSRYGEPGEPFDPTLHDALSHLGTDPDVQVTTVKHVAKPGYKIGDRVVRAAQVLVVDPAEA